MKKLIAGKTVKVNDEGYLTDFNEWDKNVANELADEHRIKLNDRHWNVIGFLQDQLGYGANKETK